MRVLLLALLTLPAAALAQDADGTDETGRTIKYQERTEIDFDALNIDAPLVKPLGVTVNERTEFKSRSLIEPRTNFNVEMLESVSLVK